MIDELLNRFRDQIQADDGTALSKPEETYQAQALTAIYEIGLESIGADEPTGQANVTYIADNLSEITDLPRIAKNALRADQRKAWAKACGVAEK